MLAASFVVLLPPLVVQRTIDGIAARSESLNLLGAAALILGLALVESGFRYTARRLLSGTSRRVEYDIRGDIATRLFHLDQGFYLQAQTGDLMARCTNDLQRVRDLLGPALQDLFRLPITMLLGLVLMLRIDVGLALVSMTYFPLVALAIIAIRTTMERKYDAVQEQFSTLTNRVQENISGMRTIKAYAQEDTEIAAFTVAQEEMRRRSMDWARYSGGLMALTSIAAGVSTLIVLWFGGQKVVAGELTVGQLVQFIAYLAILASPVLSLGWTISIAQEGTVGWKRVKELLTTEPGITSSSDAVHPRNLQGHIVFEHVTFGYGDRAVLRDVSLVVPAGSTVAVVGETGAGKTTLVHLLVRLHDPWSGRITLDGVDLRDLDLADLRAAVAFVPQESFLFSEPLRDNIAYAQTDATPDDIDHVLHVSRLDTDLAQLTDGLDTVIGERGVTLSGGQKQRAALARALLKEAPVLVLDDALAHVDTHTEDEILQGLRAATARQTTFIIAHRTSTVEAADLIVVLEDGGIAEQGTHAELLARGGRYARLHSRQRRAEQRVDEILDGVL